MSGFKRSILAIFFICYSLPTTFAQKGVEAELNKLEKERKFNKNKITEIQDVLSANEKRKKVSVGQLSALKRQIQIREQQIDILKKELKAINDQVEDLNIFITALKEDLEQLQSEYASMIYHASKQNNSMQELKFLFASDSFYELFMRSKLLEQYQESRSFQIKEISKVAKSLEDQRETLAKKESNKKSLLNDELDHSRTLKDLQGSQQTIISQLSKKGKDLRKELKRRKAADERLNKLITSAIKGESKGVTRSESSTTRKIISGSFENNRKKLPWPVSSGFIAEKFGLWSHPVLKGITRQNNGISIQTKTNEVVKPVYDGKVISVAIIPGSGKAVIMQHGDYFTVYSKLREVYVNKGQSITASDAIGVVGTNEDGIAGLEFQIYKKTQKLNPEKWLARR